MTRRDRNAAATRRDILAAGLEMFSRYPYAEVTDKHICDGAGVTRGALQHHFGCKLGLFTTILEDLYRDAVVRITDAASHTGEGWHRVRAGIAAFFDVCTQPPYQTLALQQAPIAIGWQRCRELETHYYGDLMRASIDILAPAGLGNHTTAMLIATLRGTLTELGLQIAQSSQRDAARHEAFAAVDRLLRTCQRSPASTAPDAPIDIGIGQLRAHTISYLDRVQSGETFHVTRRGRVMALLQAGSTSDAN